MLVLSITSITYNGMNYFKISENISGLEGDTMKLSFAQIKEMTWGTARIIEEEGCLCFYRCTKAQEDFFKRRKDEFYRHSLGTAGVRLVFTTDSKRLLLKVRVRNISARKRFSFDVFANEKLVGYLDNFTDIELPVDGTTIELPVGDFEQIFDLSEGQKTVCVHFPYSARGMIREVVLDEGTTFEPVKPQKKMLAYGDSITQGYYALRPSNRYIARLADYLGAEEMNKAIGSDRFCAELATLTDDIIPDYIVVAHGTNDWRTSRTREAFREESGAFLRKIQEQYPAAKIIVISPIWRKDYTDERPFGDFTKLEEELRVVTKDMDNITMIHGFDLVPHEEQYFGDLQLHPNDNGFEAYFTNLMKQYRKTE